jgi:antitoxin PrlF
MELAGIDITTDGAVIRSIVSDTGLIVVRKILTSLTAHDILVPAMITSKITSKAQTTIPQPVRAALRVGEGDEVAYRIEGDHVILTKAKREPNDDPFATFREWSSEADRRAYGDL